jgi:hypothetical protein
MAANTFFISSTYKDLKEHRREIWESLKQFNVTVRGMEEFGARTAGALETCLAEVEQCDVYVGIIAYRLGSTDPESNKPFTVLEYEKAAELKKEILIYIADDDMASFPRSLMDEDGRTRKRLDAFKQRLRERHTIGSFSTPEDLSEKLSRDFRKHFASRQPEQDRVKPEKELFAQTEHVLRDFRLIPKRYNGAEILLRASFHHDLFPASRELCLRFNLEYGLTIGSYMRIVQPANSVLTSGLYQIFATGRTIDRFRELIASKEADLYANCSSHRRMCGAIAANSWGELSISTTSQTAVIRARFYIAPEGKAILLFTKPA